MNITFEQEENNARASIATRDRSKLSVNSNVYDDFDPDGLLLSNSESDLDCLDLEDHNYRESVKDAGVKENISGKDDIGTSNTASWRPLVNLRESTSPNQAPMKVTKKHAPMKVAKKHAPIFPPLNTGQQSQPTYNPNCNKRNIRRRNNRKRNNARNRRAMLDHGRRQRNYIMRVNSGVRNEGPNFFNDFHLSRNNVSCGSNFVPNRQRVDLMQIANYDANDGGIGHSPEPMAKCLTFLSQMMQLTTGNVHKPTYDMRVQREIHYIQNKHFQYKCGGDVVSSDGPGINCIITPYSSGITLNCRFTCQRRT